MEIDVQKKYTISPDWILRHDPCYYDTYSLFNVYSRSLLNLTPALFCLLKLFYFNALSFIEVKDYLSSHGVDNVDIDILGSLPEKYGIPEVLIPSEKALHRKVKDVQVLNEVAVPVTSTPMDVELLLTHNCNLKCKHCFQSSAPNSDYRRLLKVSDWYDIFRQFEDLNVYSVIISGGEPMMYKGFEELLSRVSDLRLSINILTNGMLITPSNLDIFLKKNVALTISLDGHNSQTHDYLRGSGAFERIDKTLDLLVENGAEINIAHTLHRYNYRYLEDFINYLINKGLKNLSINFIEPEGRASLNQDLLLDKDEERIMYVKINELSEKYSEVIHIDFPNLSYKKSVKGYSVSGAIYCSAGTKRIAVSSDGRLFPCVYAIDYPELEIGNLREKSLLELWGSHLWDRFRGGIKLEDIEKCSNCELSASCSMKNCRIRYYNKKTGLYAKPYKCFIDREC